MTGKEDHKRADNQVLTIEYSDCVPTSQLTTPVSSTISISGSDFTIQDTTHSASDDSETNVEYTSRNEGSPIAPSQ